jgi:hypothetical protein
MVGLPLWTALVASFSRSSDIADSTFVPDAGELNRLWEMAWNSHPRTMKKPISNRVLGHVEQDDEPRQTVVLLLMAIALRGNEMADTTIQEFKGVQHFVFDAGLYAEYRIDTVWEASARALFGYYVIDGHCVRCRRTSTFKSEGRVFARDSPGYGEISDSKWETRAQCTRNNKHGIWIAFHKHENVVWKVGQWPSVADIANDEARPFLSVLGRNDAAELHKAIGLASHGVGVGSYVYLRRVFEHLISRTFDEHAVQASWDRAQFMTMHMEDKVDLLHDFLPPFMVTNRKVWSILSKGIHELTEAECLGYFDVLKLAIVTMLKERKRMADDAAQAKQIEHALGELHQRLGTTVPE